jgi:hypothetical protein
MRACFICLLLFALSTFNVSAQTGGSSGTSYKPAETSGAVYAGSDSIIYRLGTKSVVIPEPDGFVEATAQSDSIARLFTATESPENEMLAVHIPKEVLEKIKREGNADLNFYTKVSISRRLKALDVTDDDFAKLVAALPAVSNRVLDIKGPEMQKIERDINSGLTELSGEDMNLKFDQPVNLGYFEKTKNVFSMMIVMKLKNRTDKLPLLCGMSFVKINQRLLFVYTYRRYESSKDVEILQNFTRKWIKQILAAN